MDTTQLDPVDKQQRQLLRTRLSLRDSVSGWGKRPVWRQDRDGLQSMVAFDLGMEGHLDFTGQSHLYADTSVASHYLVAGGRLRPRVDVLLGNFVSLWARVRQVTEGSDVARYKKEMNPRTGVYQTALFLGSNEYGKLRTHDWVEGGLEAQALGIRVQSGLFPVRWGSQPIEPMFLSGIAEAMPMTQASTQIGPIEATVLGARLLGDTFAERRLLYAHRYRYRGQKVSFAWSEAVISVDRDLEPLYLVPVLPHIFVEHYLGDPDNRQMDMELEWRARPDLQVGAELFLDDLQNYLGFFSKGWGNKWGLSLGLTARDWTGPRTLDQFQITRIEPWTGGNSSAVLPGAPRNLPVHFGASLGSQLGPNSLQLRWKHRQDLSERWSWFANTNASWKGTTPGSSIDDQNWRDSSGTYVVAWPDKKWLDGNLARKISVDLGGEWRFANSWRTTLSVGVGTEDSLHHSKVWPQMSWRIHFRE
jgi:hypothetical protein